jgi:hypothetical protein
MSSRTRATSLHPSAAAYEVHHFINQSSSPSASSHNNPHNTHVAGGGTIVPILVHTASMTMVDQRIDSMHPLGHRAGAPSPSPSVSALPPLPMKGLGGRQASSQSPPATPGAFAGGARNNSATPTGGNSSRGASPNTTLFSSPPLSLATVRGVGDPNHSRDRPISPSVHNKQLSPLPLQSLTLQSHALSNPRAEGGGIGTKSNTIKDNNDRHHLHTHTSNGHLNDSMNGSHIEKSSVTATPLNGHRGLPREIPPLSTDKVLLMSMSYSFIIIVLIHFDGCIIDIIQYPSSCTIRGKHVICHIYSRISIDVPLVFC